MSPDSLFRGNANPVGAKQALFDEGNPEIIPITALGILLLTSKAYPLTL